MSAIETEARPAAPEAEQQPVLDLKNATNFARVTERFSQVKYMNERRARIMRDLTHRFGARHIIEIGFFRGKSSAYIGAILEDQGAGKLTTIDRLTADRLPEPNIHNLIRELGLSHRVEPIFAHRSFTWELSKLMRMDPTPRFDLCYFDGGHTWDDTGFGFTLVNYLLKPGGVIVFDDINWTISGSKSYKRDSELMSRFSEDERACQSVRLVWDTLVPLMGYTRIEEIASAGWAVAQKPAGAEAMSLPLTRSLPTRSL